MAARRAITLIVFLIFVTCAVAWGQIVGVTINGVPLEGGAIIVSGISYAPVDALAMTLGLSIEWDPSSGAIIVDGQRLAIRTLEREGALYIPLAAFARAEGAKVKWNGRRRIVEISTQGRVPKASATPVYSPLASPIPTPEPTKLSPTPRPTKPAPVASEVPFTPVTATDSVFSVTVTNVEVLANIKGFYAPKAGYKFVMVNLQQLNISNEVQIYTGKFSLVDSNNKVYEYIEGLSNFWLVILRPGGANFGYLVFEIPSSGKPASLVLHAAARPPLTIRL